MSAAEIVEKTGIEQRLYSRLTLEELGLEAARVGAGARRTRAGRARRRARRDVHQHQADPLGRDLDLRRAGHRSDACGLRHRRRLRRPALRPARRHPADAGRQGAGAAGLRREVLRQDRQRPAVAHDLRRRGGRRSCSASRRTASRPDIEYLQTFASGPASEVNSIIWPNTEFDNNITVYGPEVKAWPGRYLLQMVDELRALPAPDGGAGNLLDAIDLIVPHQANKTMVTQLAHEGRPGSRPASTSTSRRSATRPPPASRSPSTTRCATGCSPSRSRIFAPGIRSRGGRRIRRAAGGSEGGRHRPSRSSRRRGASWPRSPESGRRSLVSSREVTLRGCGCPVPAARLRRSGALCTGHPAAAPCRDAAIAAFRQISPHHNGCPTR